MAFKQCFRCGEIFKSKTRYSKICPDCIKKRTSYNMNHSHQERLERLREIYEGRDIL